MDYLYENLGPEEFQRFCQVLISKEFPDVQCFPVGQPDGGRDSISYGMTKTRKEFVVFQVKFVRKPLAVTDIHKWLVDTIKGELEKTKRLIPMGASKYYLLTNVPGTAHLNSGSIDQLNAALESEVKIPSMVWWRDDLSIRLEKDPIFKWSFPQIINGQDVLNSALFEIINGDRDRRENAIRAYLKDQYNQDNEVKFRQIELANRLYDLFTDVPVGIKKIEDSNNLLEYTLNRIFPDGFSRRRPESIGAAEFLLNPLTQENIPRILLEGGPGQGKSTISQYICQVHRSRLLKVQSDIDQLSEKILASPVKLPFKIDLRHVSSWLNEKNPYSSRLNDIEFSQIWRKSLESFIIAHIRYHSQLDFDVNDFLEVSKKSPILLVFDGFDEIADFDQRREVIEFINDGASRLESNCKTLQIIVTSRPAAFSDSIEFSANLYPHFESLDINSKIIGQYVEKWIKSSKLGDTDAFELRRLVKEKLQLPHLRDLAKSPMQLAIFISLLRTRGESLPNKRTALYDSYIELFFNRESEKNQIIRDKRELIIDMHQYLAWVLHSEAELYNNNGSMDVDSIQKKLVEYLSKENQDTSIAGSLFSIMNERVCALVSRVQGTFEFEVQPLREYFCAKYLYNTAPPSNVGNETKGALPDRFDAISRSFYWQNVVRFFAGCFRKAELPLLSLKLKELEKDNHLRYTNYPVILTSQLLSDYVFDQYQAVSLEIIEGITTYISSGKTKMLFDESETLSLPISCGGEEIVNACFEKLKQFPPFEEAQELIYMLTTTSSNIESKWLEILNEEKYTGAKLTSWIRLAANIDILYDLDKNLILELLSESGGEQPKRFQIILFYDSEFILKNPQLLEIALGLVMNGEIVFHTRYDAPNHLKIFLGVTNPFFWKSVLISETDSSSLSSLMEIYFHRPYFGEEEEQPIDNSIKILNNDLNNDLIDFYEGIKNIIHTELVSPERVLFVLDDIIEKWRKIFGSDSHIFEIIAAMAAKHKSDNINSHETSDSSQSLVKRLRYIRSRSGNIKYWTEKLTQTENKNLNLFLLLGWGTQKTISSIIKQLDFEVNALDKQSYEKLEIDLILFQKINSFNPEHADLLKLSLAENNISNKLIHLLALRMDDYARSIYKWRNLSDKNYPFFEGAILYELIFDLHNSSEGKTMLASIREEYSLMLEMANSRTNNDSSLMNFDIDADELNFPISVDNEIIDSFQQYPLKLVSHAEISSKKEAYKAIRPVGQIAKDDKWFE